jgi:hypothetical protein
MKEKVAAKTTWHREERLISILDFVTFFTTKAAIDAIELKAVEQVAANKSCDITSLELFGEGEKKELPWG